MGNNIIISDTDNCVKGDRISSKTIQILFNKFKSFIEYPAFSNYDEICLECEKNDDNKRILIDKVNDLVDITNEQEKKKRINDFLNELKGFQWLSKNDYKNIKFLDKSKNKKPDFQALNEYGLLYYIEIKTINYSKELDYNITLTQRNQCFPGWDINSPYKNSFKNKITDDILKAHEQFKSIKAKKRLLIIFYSLSLEVLMDNNDINSLDDVLGDSFFKIYEHDYHMTIITIKDNDKEFFKIAR